MNKDQANIEAKKIYDSWSKKKEQIEKQAKEEGKWSKTGLDSNKHLFKEVDEEAKKKLKMLNSLIDED